MSRNHRYELTVEWTGNTGLGTIGYRSYDRSHDIVAKGRSPIAASADPTFLGDATRWNPEQLLVASISQCHMLWYLHLAAEAGIVVWAYVDHPMGSMTENDDGSGQFEEVVLRPEVTITSADRIRDADTLHDAVDAKCFVARSVTFPIRHEPLTRTVQELSV